MKRLYLLRHAKSSWDDPTLADDDRPLAPRGRRAAKVMAKHLRQKGIGPELVLCSPATRTRQTLTRLAPALGKNADVRIEPELYAAPAAVLLEVLHEVPDEVESAMLIGHNPGIQDLALSLAGAGSEIPRLGSKFPTAALATLELNGTWRELAPGSSADRVAHRAERCGEPCCCLAPAAAAWQTSDAGLDPHANQRIAARLASSDRMTLQLLALDNEPHRPTVTGQVAPPDLALGPTDRDRHLVSLVSAKDGDRVLAPCPPPGVGDERDATGRPPLLSDRSGT